MITVTATMAEVGQLADEFGVSHRTARDWCGKGRFPATRLRSGAWLVEREAFAEFVRRRKEKREAQAAFA